MIYDKNPDDQLEECLYGLAAVKYALENKEICEDGSLASHLQTIEYSLRDAIARIEQKHKDRYQGVLNNLSDHHSPNPPRLVRSQLPTK
jgi:hypothetical protein